MSVTEKDKSNSEPLAFIWMVPESGFQWQDLIPNPFGTENPTKALVCRNPKDRMRFYDPMKSEDPLFLEFARLPLNLENILAFANEYGWLSGSISFQPTPAKKGEPSPVVKGDTLNLWREEILNMKEGVDLWWALERPNDPRDLRKYITRRAENAIWSPREGYIVALRDPQWTKSDIYGPAKTFLAEHINKGIGERVAPRLTIAADGCIRPSLRPAHLLGALWYQFYLAFTGETRLGRCSECPELMTYTRKTKRMHTKCANRKRQAQFKERRRGKKARSK